MTYTKTQLLDIVKNQLALEYNCSPDHFNGQQNIVTHSVLHQGARRFDDKPALFKMVTLGDNAVVSADERLCRWLRKFVANKQGRHLFEHHNAFEINARLRRYGGSLRTTHHMFLPGESAPIHSDVQVEWFEQRQLHQFYDGRFPNALCEQFAPHHPDMLAVAACDGEPVGMAGCSADTPLMWQIGIDVNQSHRGRGIGAYLVSLLKCEILRRGKIPYYGTSLSNLPSWKIALRCGFYPAWIELTARYEKV